MKNFIKNKNNEIIIGLVCFLLVFMLMVQFRTINNSESEMLRLKNEDQLRDEIAQWHDMYDIANEKIAELNGKVEEYRVAASKTSNSTALIKKELDNANIIAGLVPLKGTGVQIILDDTKALEQIMKDAGYYDPNVFVIHDSDILTIVNELRAAGAEAISINGQRIISNSEIRCIGPVISINSARIAAPFTITAIGESEQLVGALSLRGGIVDTLRQSSIEVTIEKKNEVLVPKYDSTIINKYAVPVSESEGI